MQAGDGVDDPAFLPWHHLKAHALVDVGELEAAERFIASAAALARAAREPAAGHEARPRARPGWSSPVTISVGPRPVLEEARAMVESIGVPFEQGLIELTQGQVLRRAGERRAAAATLVAAQERFSALGAQPALKPLREGARRVWLGAVAAQDARLPRPDPAGARGHAAGRLRHDEPRGRPRS